MRRPVDPGHGASAAVCLAQNASTARRLGRPDVTVLPNALTVELPQLGPAEPRGTDIAFVGRLVPWKGGPLAVRGTASRAAPRAVLRVFGDGPTATASCAAAERWGLRDRVDLVGSPSPRRAAGRLRRCGALLHPALHEEAGLSVAEALGLGVPVVGLDHGGPAELVSWWPSDRSRLVPLGGPDATARRLAAAVDAFLDEAPTPPAEPVPPVASFESLLLDAYDRAVDRTGRVTPTGRSSPAGGTGRSQLNVSAP